MKFLHVSVESCQTDFPLNYSANDPVSQLPSQLCHLNFRNGRRIEHLNSLLVQTACSFAPHNDFCLSNRGHFHDNEDITPCTSPPCDTGVRFDLRSAFSPVRCTVVKQRHGGETLKVKISVRGRRSRESRAPLGIAHQPLSRVQGCIIKMAGRGEKELRVERQQRKKSEERESLMKSSDMEARVCGPQWLWSSGSFSSHVHCTIYMVIYSSQVYSVSSIINARKVLNAKFNADYGWD